MNKYFGYILIIIGVIMLIWTGFSYTKKEKVIDAGALEVSVDKKRYVNWPPFLGGILIVGGIVIVMTAKKK